MNDKADKDFFETQLRALFPSASSWPSEYVHQKALLAATNEVTALARAAEAEFRNVDANKDFTPQAKRRRRAELASEFISKLETSKARTRATETCEDMLAKYEAKINSNLKSATDPQWVGVHAQIREQLLAIKDPKERMSFFERNGNDLTLISAALSAPPYVSGLSEAEVALLRKKLEQHAPPEIIAERDFVNSALGEIARGYHAAASRIAKRGGLDKGLDGSWSQCANAA